MKPSKIAILALSCVWAAGARGQGEIDTFDTWQFLSVPFEESGSAWTSDIAPEALGGERDLYVHRIGGSMDTLYCDVAVSLPNTVSLACGSGVIGSCHIVYDGVDGSEAINYTGLGGIDLTGGGTRNAISFAVASDLGAAVTVTVYQDATRYSVATVEIPADPTFTFADRVIGMTEFQPAGPDGGADFTQVGALEFEIGDGPSDADIMVQIIGTVYDPRFVPPPPPPPPVVTFAPKTQGYWQNHPAAWTVDSLTLGAVTYSKAQLINLLAQPTKGDASMILAHQLIATKLNLAKGSSTSIAGAVATADSLLASFNGALPFKVSKKDARRQPMIDAAALLDAYNNSGE